ncbi:unnamed protein product [Nippostrongylus brasiliensis]|uniref:Formactin (inferred by orthology to a C. elegans protein) n=1 Tax=Nippostrongylus brasiliensis TaxID=27835 RepID=A0A0N4YHP5_NIPBR|nr:unnamed protein product [Nippostrongylus brasiliensis]
MFEGGFDIVLDDRDLVPEFVQNGGLDCMVRLGRLADQNHQNYILRALGQVMLYVDGMNGIIAHNTTIQWLYELLDSPCLVNCRVLSLLSIVMCLCSVQLFDEKERREMSPFRLEWKAQRQRDKRIMACRAGIGLQEGPNVVFQKAEIRAFRLVVKTALKLLLVFIEYNDNNALLVLAAISAVDRAKGQQDWSGLMKVISEKDSPDPETLVYGMTVINKTLRGIPDSMDYGYSRLGKNIRDAYRESHVFSDFDRFRQIQDTYYDAVDTLEMLGMEEAMKSMTKLANNELLEQCRLYERELNKEDERAENSDDDANARMRGSGGMAATTRRRPSNLPNVNNAPQKMRSSPLTPVDDVPSQTARSNPAPTFSSPSSFSPPEAQQPYRPTNGWTYSAIPPRTSTFNGDDADARREHHHETDEGLSRASSTTQRKSSSSTESSYSPGNPKRDRKFFFRAPSQQTMHDTDRRSAMRRRHQEARQRQEEHIAFAQSRNIFAKENEPPPEPKSSVPWRNEAAEQNNIARPKNDLPPPVKKIPEPIRIVNDEQPKTIPEPIRIERQDSQDNGTASAEEQHHDHENFMLVRALCWLGERVP